MDWTFLGFLPVLCAVSVTASSDDGLKCDSGRFFDVESQRCRDCSNCPLDQIVKIVCSDYQDVVCGDFKEFVEFNPHKEEALNITIKSFHQDDNQTNSIPSDSSRAISLAFAIGFSLIFITVVVILLGLWWRKKNLNKDMSTVVYQRGSTNDPEDPPEENVTRYISM